MISAFVGAIFLLLFALCYAIAGFTWPSISAALFPQLLSDSILYILGRMGLTFLLFIALQLILGLVHWIKDSI